MFRMADGLPVVAAYIHDEDGKKIVTFSDVAADKRDPPITNQIITPGQALVYWITGLQTEEQYGLPSIRVKGMDDLDDDWTEIDLHNDDPTNLIDGTWTDPIVVMQDEDDR